MLLDYIVSNVFYILGMAHRVHYVTRIDWTPRKLHSNAVFRHSLAPDKLEPPHSVPISFKTQYCSHRSAPTMSFSIRRILQHLHTHTLNPGIQIPVHWHTVHLISFQSVHFYPHPFSGHPFPTVPIYLILKHWYAHIRYQLIGMQYVPVSFIRYQLIGMRNVSLSVMGYRLIGMQYVSVLIMRYRLIGMQNTSISIIRYRLTGMQYIPISFTTYRLSDMQYISATFIMYHLIGMRCLYQQKASDSCIPSS